MLSNVDLETYIKFRPYAKWFKGVIDVARLNRSLLPKYKEFYILLLRRPNQPGHWMFIQRVKFGWNIFDSYGLPMDERIFRWIEEYDHFYRAEHDHCQIPFSSINRNVEDIQTFRPPTSSATARDVPPGIDSNQCGSWCLFMLDAIFAHSKRGTVGGSPVTNFRTALLSLSPDGGVPNFHKLLAHFQ